MVHDYVTHIHRWSGNTDTSSIRKKKISLYVLIGETLSITHSNRRSRWTDVLTSWLKIRSQHPNGGKLCDPSPPHHTPSSWWPTNTEGGYITFFLVADSQVVISPDRIDKLEWFDKWSVIYDSLGGVLYLTH